MNETKLKSCPFCGREVTTSVSVCDTFFGHCIMFGVYCPACKVGQYIHIENYDNFEEAEKAMHKAVEVWNRRKVGNNNA